MLVLLLFASNFVSSEPSDSKDREFEYLLNSNLDSARTYIEKSKDNSSISNPELIRHEFDLLNAEGRLEEAQDQIVALKTMLSNGDYTDQNCILYMESVLLLKKFRIQEALENHSKMELSDVNIEDKINIYLQRSFLLMMSHSYDSANYYISQSDSILTETQLEHLKGDLLYLKGVMCYDHSDFECVLEQTLLAQKVFEKLSYKAKIARCLDLIGSALYNKQDYDQAIKNFIESGNLQRQLGDSTKVTRADVQLAACYTAIGKLDTAIAIYKKFVKRNKKIGAFAKEMQNYINLGTVYQKKNDYIQAIYYFKEALFIAEKNNITRGLVQAKLLLGQSYIMTNSYKDAVLELEQSFEAATQIRDLTVISMASGSLAEAYDKLSRFDKAFYYLNLHKTLNDSMIQLRNDENLLRIETQLKLNEAKEEKLIAENNFNKEQLKSSRYRNSLLVTGVIALIILLLGVILINRLRNAKLKIQYEKEALSSQVGSFKKTMVQKISMINSLKEKMENERVAPEITQDLLTLITEDKDWLGFMGEYERINPRFFNDLRKNAPDLTQNELRISTLMKLNLSTKEIASILNIETESARKAKQRLKKKLKVPEEVKIDSFIGNLGLS
ncbi:MAG: tetratricopeptide repeat protein [Flavobacteriales bacterium]|nr:tetratricopeptide repeat protein [Flavobacteriales bacterium]